MVLLKLLKQDEFFFFFRRDCLTILQGDEEMLITCPIQADHRWLEHFSIIVSRIGFSAFLHALDGEILGPNQLIQCTSRWWQLKDFFLFSPLPTWEMIQFDLYIYIFFKWVGSTIN